VDKFTKWIEVKPVASITTAQAVEFIKETMYKFGIPNNIITDNRTQFTMRELKDFCPNSGNKINYALLSHPQRNGQVECSNGMMLVDILYAAPQVHEIVNVAFHREYSPYIIFIFSQGRKDLYHVKD
jgi:transposase InsO family protein